ncbi:MAG: DUF4307 domain-containing protein [Cellulomonas sp.]|uniref:DUF4307 domain-containing protein n=1 Tax=Cellulomonas gelida TaxID=1712 RepID=A0A4Y3KRC7_9CELL|nr:MULTISPECIES: DUF4307 domain-containing protein [Cellulomonas]KMM45833.1 secretion protein HlyD [Cellulomonas sp. A375-1]MCR6649910.1 DUF4307 domain-containing protein [Cellulomonas sp.]MCR6705802.1 DUF4307 domain-containing protein [Cellulomonas sp.]GEA85438.1 hypothetical protein CGE01nite_26890 [Cellulomonas gelida]GGL14823.1 hypothetical protein GCM10009774_01730 [Cellulomonas gelida]
MGSTPAASATPPAGRYGPDPDERSRVPWLVTVVLTTLVAAVVVAWVGIGALRDPVQWKDVGFSVQGADTIAVTFEVTKDPESTATCRVRALSQSYAEVGVKNVEIGPGARTQRVTVVVPTAELAVTGTVSLCEPVDARP